MKIDRVKFAMALAKENISCLKLAERTGLSRVTITKCKIREELHKVYC